MQTNLCLNHTLALAAPDSGIHFRNCATTYAIFHGRESHPNSLQKQDILQAQLSGFLFARKFRSRPGFTIDNLPPLFVPTSTVQACPSTLIHDQLYMPPWLPATTHPQNNIDDITGFGNTKLNIHSGNVSNDAESAPQSSVSFVFLLSHGFPAKPTWDNFFNSCRTQKQPVSALIFVTNPAPGSHSHVFRGNEEPHAPSSCPQTAWASCGQVPAHTSSGAGTMMDAMHLGVQQSPQHSTVVFVSGQSVPLVSCQATVNFLIGKILMEHVRFPPRSALLRPISTTYSRPTIISEEQCRGVPWMSVPRRIWRENVHLNAYKGRVARGVVPGPAVQWWMQTHLCMNATLRVVPISSVYNVHNCATTISAPALDPTKLADYVRNGFLFAEISAIASISMSSLSRLTLSERAGTVCAKTKQQMDSLLAWKDCL